MGELFTIGHSQHTSDYFVELLQMHDINYVLDVRSTPYSKYAEQFNRENIKSLLEGRNINYSFMGKFFGARPADLSLYSREGYLDFKRVSQSDIFQKGLENVRLGINAGNRIALMCTEKDPIDCHRAIMVARAFDLHGIEVKHILPDGVIQTQKQLDSRLIEMYFPDRGQLSLFNLNSEMNDVEYAEKAYKKRNEEIGYRIEKRTAEVV